MLIWLCNRYTMSYSLKIKNNAIKLRKEGNSLSSISIKLGVSKSTISTWLKDVVLSKEASEKISNKIVLGQQKANKVKKQRKQIRLNSLNSLVRNYLLKEDFSTNYLKVICALLFWAEGSKSGSFVSFINSDPEMISLFLFTLRKSFSIDEDKLRGLVHVHEYHDQREIEKYWSEVSGISLHKFSKSYKKPNSGKRKKSGYKGSFRIRYYDVKVAEELTSIYTMLPELIINGTTK